MIDIHSHILPGFDNGARTEDESIAMVHKAMSEGIDKIILTPSYISGESLVNPDQIFEAVSLLDNKLYEMNVPVKVYPGQLIHVYGEISTDLENGDLLPLNHKSQYVLIKLPNSHVPQYIEKLFFDIQIKGYTPVIAQPELNQELMEKPNVLYYLVKSGALTQVNTGSIAGKNGKKIQKLSLDLLERNLIHFLGTDATRPSRNGFFMKDALRLINKEFGDVVTYQLKSNNEAILEGMPISKKEPIYFESKKIWKIFSRN
ncbi:tyrosine-protein phosphatase [Ornithinibacillus halophilus]|uniref:Tyrosine-protein phosphatase n=1 Tax=Ornithinibacillus halophilus TaxID=930117 RepID=A0A1M5GH53_9BACI|nr:CpsB/CapC family capsule biosynthesis tyrosine phosphatase [Ornithinibacillus halophilus]SHG03018.1 protein-tyrosine phosphatase [Ornithinibacillus halophilus]